MTLAARRAVRSARAAVCAQAPAAAPATRKRPRRKSQMCQGCHGIPGWRTAYPEVYRVPKIAGQHPPYLVKALQEYKSGERTHPSMRAIAASLSDRHGDLAAYYAQLGTADGEQMTTTLRIARSPRRLPLLARRRRRDAAADLEAGKQKVKEVCQACHGMDGNSPIPDYPKLGGQYPDYLAKALRDYKSGARKNADHAGHGRHAHANATSTTSPPITRRSRAVLAIEDVASRAAFSAARARQSR